MEVLESLPIALAGEEKLLLFIIPSGSFLGEDETDYSRVTVKAFNQDLVELTSESEVPQVAYFSTGRLGALTGGLLHTADCRRMLSREDIAETQAHEFQQVVATQKECVQHEEEKVTKKRKVTQEKTEEMKERLQGYEDKSILQEKEVASWKSLWCKLLGVSQSGPEKETDETWKDALLRMTDNDEAIESTCPVELNGASLPWSDVLLTIATHVSKMDKNSQTTKHRLSKLAKTLDRRQRNHVVKEQRMVAKIAEQGDADIRAQQLKLVLSGSFCYTPVN